MKSLLDPSFVYVPSVETDIRKTFARVRREQRKQQAEDAQRAPTPLLSFKKPDGRPRG